MKMKPVLLSALLALFVSQATLAAPGKKGDKKPPLEAIEACEGQTEGQEVSFETRRGHTLNATCEYIDEQLVAVPEHHKKAKRE